MAYKLSANLQNGRHIRAWPWSLRNLSLVVLGIAVSWSLWCAQKARHQIALPKDCLVVVSPACANRSDCSKPEPRKTEEEVFQLMKQICTAQSKPPGCFEAAAGMAYESGTEIGMDEQKAAQNYEIACQLKAIPACLGLARLLEAGRGVKQDMARAEQLFKDYPYGYYGKNREACQKGDGRACVEVARCYLTPQSNCGGFPPIPELGRAYLLKGCGLGDPQTCYELARHEEKGDFWPADIQHAAAMYREICDKQGVAGCMALARMSWQGVGDVPNVGRPEERLQRACRLGMHPACRYLSFEAACNNGSGAGCFWSGRYYSNLFYSWQANGERERQSNGTLGLSETWSSFQYQIVHSDVIHTPEWDQSPRGFFYEDEHRATDLFIRGCKLGYQPACRFYGWSLLSAENTTPEILSKAEKALSADCSAKREWGCLARDLIRCQKGDGNICKDAANQLTSLLGRTNLATTSYLQGCHSGDYSSCYTLLHWPENTPMPLHPPTQFPSNTCQNTVKNLINDHEIPLCKKDDPAACMLTEARIEDENAKSAPGVNGGTRAAGKGFYGGTSAGGASRSNWLGSGEPVQPDPRPPISYSDLAGPLYRARCEKHDAESCWHVAELIGHGRYRLPLLGQPYNDSRNAAMPWYEKACAGKVRPACIWLADQRQGDQGSGEVYEKACAAGSRKYCLRFASWQRWNRPTVDPASFLDTLQTTCGMGDDLACATLGDAETKNSKIPSNLSRATLHFQKACEFGNVRKCLELQLTKDCEANQGLACAELSFMHEYEEAPARKSCDLNEPLGCYELGMSLRQKSHWIFREPADAPDPGKPFLESACKAGIPNACGQLLPPITSGPRI